MLIKRNMFDWFVNNCLVGWFLNETKTDGLIIQLQDNRQTSNSDHGGD